jgi:hypothetical protein
MGQEISLAVNGWRRFQEPQSAAQQPRKAEEHLVSFEPI